MREREKERKREREREFIEYSLNVDVSFEEVERSRLLWAEPNE